MPNTAITAGKTTFKPMNATKPKLPGFTSLPMTYAALCRMHLPRALHDDIGLDAVTEIIDLMAGHALNKDQWDYLETLAELAEGYESANHKTLPASAATSGNSIPHTSGKPPKRSALKQHSRFAISQTS